MKDLTLAAVYHMPWLEYRHALPDGRVCLRLRTARGDFDRVIARHTCGYWGEDSFAHKVDTPMALAYRDDMFDCYECAFPPRDPRVKYLFVLTSGEQTFRLDAAGLHAGEAMRDSTDDAFTFAYAYPAEPMPGWARGCVGYQIFPDRFRRASDTPADEALEDWRTSERYENERRFGGDLRGAREAVPYLKALGVDVVYATPIFLSDSSHRYNTFDYYAIDPMLGTRDDLKALCDELHQNGMRLVLDGVFNHSGTGFKPFVDALERGKASAYYDWFFFDDSDIGYRTFGFAAYMPKLNLRNEDCARYFLDVGRYWLEECGIDGWRLDVSPEVWPDFWRRYRNMMKEVNPQSLMIAECWDDSREWLTNGDMFDCTMNYVLSRAVWSRFADGDISAQAFDARVNRCMMMYPQRTQDVMWNFLGSHDTPRFRTRAHGSEALLRAAALFQMTMPGVPIIYYGDELGMQGGADPDCRRPMRWDDAEGSETLTFYKRLTALRKDSEALRYGAFRSWVAREDGLYAFLRVADGQRALVALNTGDGAVDGYIPLPDWLCGRARLTDALCGRRLTVVGDRLRAALAPGEGLVFLR